MTSFVLYSGPSSVTGPKVANYLGVSSGTSIPDRHRRADHLIRWGNSFKSSRSASDILNTGNAIGRTVNKFESLDALQSAGVPVPDFSRDPMDMDFGGDNIVFGRGEGGSGGTDINVYHDDGLDSNIGVNSDDFYSQYINASLEYRVHVFNGETIKVSQKVYRGDGSEPDDPVIRNYENGYRFIRPQTRPSGFFQAVAAVEALDLDFGAVDMVFDQNRRPYVLEVNSAPSCDPPTLETYGDAFADYLGISDPPGLDNVEFEDD